MLQFFQHCGILTTIIGLLIEFVAFAGMAFYPIRRALPCDSPLQLQAIGCYTFYAGVLLIVATRLLQ